MTKKTDFGKRQKEESDIDLSDMQKVEIGTLEGKEITIEKCFTAFSKKYPKDKFSCLVLPNKKFVLGGSVIAKQLDEFVADGMKFPATALIVKKTSKKTGNEYYALG